MLTYRGTVYPWHCDHMGHMNVMWYVGKFDEATWQFFHAVGLSPSLLRERWRGMAAVEQRISYARERVGCGVASLIYVGDDLFAGNVRCCAHGADRLKETRDFAAWRVKF